MKIRPTKHRKNTDMNMSGSAARGGITLLLLPEQHAEMAEAAGR